MDHLMLMPKEYAGSSYLMHSRTKGSKNGIRLYQYEDGTYTPLGRIHYGIGQGRKKHPESKIEKSDNKAKKYDMASKEYKNKADKEREKIDHYKEKLRRLSNDVTDAMLSGDNEKSKSAAKEITKDVRDKLPGHEHRSKDFYHDLFLYGFLPEKELNRETFHKQMIEKAGKIPIPDDLYIRDAMTSVGRCLTENLEKHYYIFVPRRNGRGPVQSPIMISRDGTKIVMSAYKPKDGLLNREKIANKTIQNVENEFAKAAERYEKARANRSHYN